VASGRPDTSQNAPVDAHRSIECARCENLTRRRKLRRVTGALRYPTDDQDIDVPLGSGERSAASNAPFDNKRIAQNSRTATKRLKNTSKILRKLAFRSTQAAVWPFERTSSNRVCVLIVTTPPNGCLVNNREVFSLRSNFFFRFLSKPGWSMTTASAATPRRYSFELERTVRYRTREFGGRVVNRSHDFERACNAAIADGRRGRGVGSMTMGGLGMPDRGRGSDKTEYTFGNRSPSRGGLPIESVRGHASKVCVPWPPSRANCGEVARERALKTRPELAIAPVGDEAAL